MHSSTIIAAGAIAFSLSFSALAHAGEGNTIFIRQESPAGSLTGNSLSIDQSNANNSTVAGPSIPSLLPYVGLTLDTALQGQPRPALQYGEGNEAAITMTGNDGVLLLLQNSSPGTASPQFLPAGTAGNEATGTVAGDSLGAVIQVGTGNTANLQLQNAQGLVGQFGTNLTANLTVGTGASGQIVQVGNGSEADLEVIAGNVTLTQTGNGLSYASGPEGANPGSSAAPIQVFTTNASNITITQIGF